MATPTMATPPPLKVSNKTISFPYMSNSRLLVDIVDAQGGKSSVSLKHIFCRYYPQYYPYLQQNAQTSLQPAIRKYYNAVIETEIKFKYKVGQFGYIYTCDIDQNEFKTSFVKIVQRVPLAKEIFFLHSQLRKYRVEYYDITSSVPKLLFSSTPEEEEPFSDEKCESEPMMNQSELNSSETELESDVSEQSEMSPGTESSHSIGSVSDDCTFTWTIESLFEAIQGLNECPNDANDEVRGLIELLNWKICREDYLLRNMNALSIKLL